MYFLSSALQKIIILVVDNKLRKNVRVLQGVPGLLQRLQGESGLPEGGQEVPLACLTSTNIERLFSYAGLIKDEKKDRWQPERLEKILSLRKNLAILGFKLEC